jgi:glucose/arabinose dehydrogenase
VVTRIRQRRGPAHAIVLCALVAACGGSDGEDGERGTAPAPERGVRVETLATGLDVPWDIAFLPDGRALLTERPGRIRLLDEQGRLQPEPVAEVRTEARGEGGLMGIALDPEFAAGQRFVYVYVTTAAGMELQRWRMTGDRLVSDGVVLDGIAAGEIHDSGRIRFGPDRALYVATGDAGQRELAQDPGSTNGKILRVPPPRYRAERVDAEVVSLGHRNPQGLAWQPGTNRLWITEHGPSGFDGPSGDDEVNIIAEGANYGWPEVRGADHGQFTAPAYVWERTVAPSGATFVTRGGSAWTGDLLVAALRGTALHRLHVRDRSVTGDDLVIDDRYGRLRGVTEAPDGALWVTTSNRDTYGEPVSEDDDRVLRVVPPR